MERRELFEQRGTILGRKDLLKRLKTNPPLIDGLIDKKKQIGTNGIDLTVKKIEKFVSKGALDLTNNERVISKTQKLVFNNEGWIHVLKGAYKIVFNEVINMPCDLVAFAKPRSSLLRSGASLETAIWDAGYRGRSEALLNVHNPFGLKIKRNARITQIVFLKLSNPNNKAYNGIFQGENLSQIEEKEAS